MYMNSLSVSKVFTILEEDGRAVAAKITAKIIKQQTNKITQGEKR